MAKKDSYWFRHDSTAGRGLRMRKMAHIYGHWGKGVYWDVIEILRDQDNYCFDSDDTSLQMLCDLIGCKDEVKFITWFRDCVKFELFTIEKNVFFSQIMREHMKTWESAKNAGISSAEARRQEKEGQKKQRNGNGTSNGTATEHPTERQHKSTVHNNTNNISLTLFDEFRQQYPGTKRGNETEFENFRKKHKDFMEVLPLLKPAVAAQILHRKNLRDKGQFVPEWKNIQTWINQRCWEEIITTAEEVKKSEASAAPERIMASSIFNTD